MKQSGKNVAFYGMFVSLAFVFSYIEVLLPFSLIVPIPGFKLGLANIVMLTILYVMGPKEALGISLIRIVLTGFTFGNMFSFFYSLVGGLLSWFVMWICKKTNRLSMVGVSVAGGISHNIGQIIVAMLVLENVAIGYYFPILLITGSLTGIVIGFVGYGMLKMVKRIFRS